MPADRRSGIGRRIAYQRGVARMTQEQLAAAANVHVATVRKIERGARGVSDIVIEAIANAMRIDETLLTATRDHAASRIQQALPELSAAIAGYDYPEDGPVRPLPQLRGAVQDALTWRLGSQYVKIVDRAPALLNELFRALHTAPSENRREVAALLVSALRSADAVAFKAGAFDLSARFVELMRWASDYADNDLVRAVVAYVRTETHLAANAYASGLSALEAAIDTAPTPDRPGACAARGALHMRAAVVAGRAGSAARADEHLAEARWLGDQMPEGIYWGTAFGPHSVRIHEVSVAVSLGSDHVHRALEVARTWAPPVDLPAERRSGFYIELGRALLWAGLPDDAFESLKVARKVAPQHTRDHQWVREDAATMRRLKRANAESLTNFAEWCHAT